MIGSDDQSAALRDVLGISPTEPPQDPAEQTNNGAKKIERPLWQHSGIRARPISPPSLFDVGAGLNQSELFN
jgi:hypothetical protein